MAIGLGGQNNMQSLAIVVLGGLFSSTIFTLFVVPSTYVLVARLQCKLFNIEEDMNPDEVLKGEKAP